MGKIKRKSFRVLFFLRKGKLLKNGEAPICMRLTVDGRMCDILIKRSILPEQWNQTKECAKGQGRNAEELNRYIESI
ncbi:Arm DNA-binding domain-containing protein [Dysgonomonas reticulitermitis]